MIENKVYHLDNRIGMQQLKEKCANLIIADPPYFEVKGDFDFVWKSFDEYLEFMEGQAILYKRILADNGTLFVWGHAKKIAYVQVIFDRYFSLESVPIWEKADCITRRYIDNYKTFAPVTERLLMYSLGNNLAKWVKDNRIRKNISQNEVDIFCGNVEKKYATKGSRLIQRWEEGSSEPTKEDFRLLQKLFKTNDCYENMVRCFNNELRLTDVMNFEQGATTYKTIDHDTIKPTNLTRALIITCSRPNDLVVVPFAGSGTECAMAAKEGRRFIGFETTEKHAVMSNKRASIEMSKLDLFRTAI